MVREKFRLKTKTEAPLLNLADLPLTCVEKISGKNAFLFSGPNCIVRLQLFIGVGEAPRARATIDPPYGELCQIQLLIV